MAIKLPISHRIEILVPYDTVISNPLKYKHTGHQTWAPWYDPELPDRKKNPRWYLFDPHLHKWIHYDDAEIGAGTTGVLINGWTYDKENHFFVRKFIQFHGEKESKSLSDYIPYAAIGVPLMTLAYRRATRPSFARGRRRRSRRIKKRRSRPSSRQRY